MKTSCEYLLVHCIDFRIQFHLNTWADKTLGRGNHDRLSIAGGVLDGRGVLRHVEISRRLHDISRVVLVNHEDCQAYGDAGTRERHHADLSGVKAQIEAAFGSLEVETYFLYLDGRLQSV